MVRREARNGGIQGKSLLAARRGIVLNNIKNKLKKEKENPPPPPPKHNQPNPGKFSVLVDIQQFFCIS